MQAVGRGGSGRGATHRTGGGRGGDEREGEASGGSEGKEGGPRDGSGDRLDNKKRGMEERWKGM